MIYRIKRWQLSEEGTGAQMERVIYDEIIAGKINAGGCKTFGPDGRLQ
jgi:hypothetical protein